jgi:RNA polymerase sigma-70 factor (ECF subfamily)
MAGSGMQCAEAPVRYRECAVVRTAGDIDRPDCVSPGRAASLRRVAGLGFSDDAALAKALGARDADAFAYLLDRYHGSLVQLARQYVPSRAVAEEVVQETWLAVIEGIDRFEGRSSVKTWLYRILLNIARSRGVQERRAIPFAATPTPDDGPSVDAHRFRRFALRDRGTWKRPPRPWGDPEQSVLDNETLDTVRRAVEQLPPDQREVVTMRDLLGWSAAEVCDALGITDGNQRVLLHRGRSKVRGALERRYDERRSL